MADHHRRLRNLEMKQEEKINDVFRQLGLRQPFKELEAGLKKAELARNVPGVRRLRDAFARDLSS